MYAYFQATLYSLRTCVIHLICSAFYLLVLLSQEHHNTFILPSMGIQATSNDLSDAIMNIPIHTFFHTFVQWSRVYRKMCTFSILLETVKCISKVYERFLTSSLNRNVVRGFVFPKLKGNPGWHWLNLHVLILQDSESLICLLVI